MATAINVSSLKKVDLICGLWLFSCLIENNIGGQQQASQQEGTRRPRPMQLGGGGQRRPQNANVIHNPFAAPSQ